MTRDGTLDVMVNNCFNVSGGTYTVCALYAILFYGHI